MVVSQEDLKGLVAILTQTQIYDVLYEYDLAAVNIVDIHRNVVLSVSYEVLYIPPTRILSHGNMNHSSLGFYVCLPMTPTGACDTRRRPLLSIHSYYLQIPALCPYSRD
jgi:hypothetical protein